VPVKEKGQQKPLNGYSYPQLTALKSTKAPGQYSTGTGGVSIQPAPTIQTHHALVDGYHVGLFMEKLEHFLEKPHETISAQK
jgi:chloramphenicol O-acetyltransferase